MELTAPALAPALNRRSLGLAGSLLIAGAMVVALTRLSNGTAPELPPLPAIDTLPLAYGPADFPAAMKLADDAVALGVERIGRRPQDWAYQESYARALMGRARLTASFDDLALAGNALATGKATATSPSGPVLTDAVHLFTIHRMAPIEADLKAFDASAVPTDIGDRAEVTALRGDIEFYSGRYDAAIARYRAAAHLFDGPGIAFRIALWQSKTGRADAALASFARAARLNVGRTPQFMANVWLQSGVVELTRGRWDTAEALFRKADRAFPGYWLTEAHVAQMVALRGDTDAAAALYRGIIARTGQPDVIDALADLYRVQGNGPASRAWATQSRAIWDTRLKQLPEAAFAHALEHQLVLGDTATALDLARRNLAARPYGDSTTMLAWALLANNRPAEARDAIEALNRTPWQSAQQYAALSQAYAMLGDSDRSDTARDAALAINPRAFDPAGPLIWFGNH